MVVLLACGAQADSLRLEDPGAAAADIEQWKDLRFGLFVHWGPASLTGKEIAWSRAGERRGQKSSKPGETPIEVYDNLYKKFNPVKFNADDWVRIAHAAGMRYLVFTVKHHDGFCEFDSKLTDYKITNPASPYGKDILKQLADACHRRGMKFGIYYSQPDWHHPDYRNGDNHWKYLQYLRGQVRELLTNYGQVDIWFFDGLGGRMEDWDAPRLVAMMRRLQPHIVINNRAGIPADYDTPENRIGFYQTLRPWETNATIAKQWSWKPEDQLRPLDECLRMLVSCAIGDGNFLLNTGPMPDGRIEPRQVDRLREMGHFLSKYGESIYGTRGGPVVAPDERARPKMGYYDNFSLAGGKWWGGTTHKGNAIYVHILRWPGDSIWLPPVAHKVLRYRALTGGRATVKQTAAGIEVSVPVGQRHTIDTIVKLELDGPVPAKVGQALASAR
jgi:alpha-L-fucosidase